MNYAQNNLKYFDISKLTLDSNRNKEDDTYIKWGNIFSGEFADITKDEDPYNVYKILKNNLLKLLRPIFMILDGIIPYPSNVTFFPKPRGYLSSLLYRMRTSIKFLENQTLFKSLTTIYYKH